jgi:hypothetical protein
MNLSAHLINEISILSGNTYHLAIIQWDIRQNYESVPSITKTILPLLDPKHLLLMEMRAGSFQSLVINCGPQDMIVRMECHQSLSSKPMVLVFCCRICKVWDLDIINRSTRGITEQNRKIWVLNISSGVFLSNFVQVDYTKFLVCLGLFSVLVSTQKLNNISNCKLSSCQIAQCILANSRYPFWSSHMFPSGPWI